MQKHLVQPADDNSRCLARDLISQMRHAVLAVTGEDTPHPHLSRIAVQADGDGTPLAFLSDIAIHTRLLKSHPQAALLIEAAGSRGDPMAQPRLSLQVTAEILPRDDRHTARIEAWVARNPKAKIYSTLPDFYFWRLNPKGAFLNAGFGKACTLARQDLIGN